MLCCKQQEEINCQVSLLDGKMLNVSIQGHVKGSDLLQKVFDQLNLVETDCFGLRYKDRYNAAQWLDQNKSLKKQITNINSLTLYFGVKFYLEDPCQLREEITRYQFFLQLKQDLLVGRIPCNNKMAAVLASLCVQSELGDFDSSQHTDGYISEFRFIPDQSEDFEHRVAELHQALRGMSPIKAETKFLEKVQRLEMYGVDLHMVTGQDGKVYYLGLTPTGISIYQNKTSIAHYFWPNISRVHFEETKFVLAVQRRSTFDGRKSVAVLLKQCCSIFIALEAHKKACIYGGDNEYSFQLDNNEICKHLWKCCVEQHAFFRLPSFSSTSFRYSGRTKKEALELSSSLRRKQPMVERTPSKRFSQNQSAENKSDSVIFKESQSVSDGDVIVQYGRDSPTSVLSSRSLPWAEENHFRGGLYSPSEEIYDSYRSRKRKPLAKVSPSGFSGSCHSDRSGDESELGLARRYRRNVSLTELSDVNHQLVRRQRRRKKSRGGDTSGSEAENDYTKKMSRTRDSSIVGSGNAQTAHTSKLGHSNSFVKRSTSYVEHSCYQDIDNHEPHQNGDTNFRIWYNDDDDDDDISAGNVKMSQIRSRRLSQGQLSEEGLIAMHELQQELVKLGQPSVNKRDLPLQQSNQQRNYIPVKVLSNKRMSLTTQEILRVSKSNGEHHDMLTEL